MNKKYSIGLFVSAVLVVGCITAAYQFSYNHAKKELLAKQEKLQKEQEETIQTEGSAKKEDTYYLSELNGYVVVYLSDKSTIYEYTNIEISSLPEDLQVEIRQGKLIETAQTLYGFLENYSS